jgi:hypothetical protein
MSDGDALSVAASRRPGVVGIFGPVAALSHIVVRGLAGLFTLVVLVLGQSALWPDSVPISAKILLLAVGVLAFVRPGTGLLLVAGLAPFGQVGARWLGWNLRGAEALVLACLSGLLLRMWRSNRFRAFPSQGIELAAWLFGLVVAASCVEQLCFLRVQRDFPWPFAHELAAMATGDYLVTFRVFGTLFNAMLLLEGLALLVCAAYCCRTDATFATRLARVLVVGAVSVAALSLVLAAERVLDSRRPLARLWQLVAEDRWTVHTGDLNAAASYFRDGFRDGRGRRTVLTQAATLAWRGLDHRHRLVDDRVAYRDPRDADRCGRGVLGFRPAAPDQPPPGAPGHDPPDRAGVDPSLCLRHGVAVWRNAGRRYPPDVRRDHRAHAGVATALRRRHRAVSALVAAFRAGELQAIYRTENAHNNFLQVAGELGGIGLAAFLALLAAAFWRSRSAPAAGALARPMLAGVAVFVVTWLGGHPLLAPVVAYPFWIAAGAIGAAGAPIGRDRPERFDDTSFGAGTMSPRGTGAGSAAVAAALAAVLLIASIPIRLDSKLQTLDWTRIAYGLHEWEVGPSGERFRWSRERVGFYVTESASAVSVPLRAISVTETTPVAVDVFVAERAASQVRLSDTGWATVEVQLSGPATRGHRLVELRVDRTWIPADEIPGSTDSRELGVQVGELAIRGSEASQPGP